MRWTTRSCQLDARGLQVNFVVNYCSIRSHRLKPTHCRSAGRQATTTHTLNSWERHFDQSFSLTAAMLDHHVQMSVFIACEQSWVYRRKYCFLSKIRWCTVINFIRSLACKRITMNTVPDITVHIESKKASEVPEGTGLTLTVTQKCVPSNIIKYRTCFLVIPPASSV